MFKTDQYSSWLCHIMKAMVGLAIVRVLVVEDHTSFRQFISSTLNKESNLQIICGVSDGLEAIQQAEQLKPDVVLLDIGLPTVNGIEVARQILGLDQESKIIFVTSECDALVVQEALSLGASGYVAKIQAGFELLAAVEAICQGGRFVSAGLAGGNFQPTS